MIELIFLAFFLGFCWFVGGLPIMAFASGPSTVFFLGTLTAIAVGYLSYRLALSDFFLRTRRAQLIAIAGAFFAFLPTISTLLNGSSTGKELQAIAPSVIKFGQEHFAELDGDKNGIIDAYELEQALNRHSFPAEERRLLSHMYEQRSGIGHVIGSSTEEYGEVTITTYHYGIDKFDLESYVSRLAEKYKHW